jgi:hypothetical protein
MRKAASLHIKQLRCSDGEAFEHFTHPACRSLAMPRVSSIVVGISSLLAGAVAAGIAVWATSLRACAADYPDLEGRWILEAAGDMKVTRNPAIFFQIEGQKIVGYDGCNFSGGTLDRPGTIRRSERACPPETIVLPLDLSDPMRQMRGTVVGQNNLLLYLPQGLARFRRALSGIY